ncbi:MAG: LicD family protein [Gammaproteobacteria bacterium]|nr:LicD family protein [Gammaproteobacteria bacterium]
MPKSKRLPVRWQKRNKVLNEHGYEVLASINKLFAENNITYWLYAGTLLGMIRDKGFVKNDTDIDIGVWDTPEVHSKLETVLTASGFTKLCDFCVGDEVLEQRFQINGVSVDFWYFKKNAEFSYTCGFNSDKKGLYVVEDQYKPTAFDDITSVRVHDINLKVPADYNYVLKTFYGNWQVPITKAEGYVQFKNPNQVHRFDVRAMCKNYAKSSIQVSYKDRIQHLLEPFLEANKS